MLKNAVRMLQRGRAVVLVPDDPQLTTQTAANFLAVLRPHLIKLLESNEIPFHKTGSHRRIRFQDAIAYAKKRDAERRTRLNGLAKDAFADGSYDDAEMPEGGEDE